MKLKVKKLHPDAKLPTQTNSTDAGIDLYALEDVDIRPGETVKVRTGIAIQLEDELEQYSNVNLVNLLWDRSGLGSKGIHRVAGVIDQEYTGECVVCLTNLNIYNFLSSLMSWPNISGTSDINYEAYQKAIIDSTYHIKKGDKIIQVLIQTVIPVKIVEVDELNETVRGSNGFGSSDSSRRPSDNTPSK